MTTTMKAMMTTKMIVAVNASLSILVATIMPFMIYGACDKSGLSGNV
jgi:hypothetical protein